MAQVTGSMNVPLTKIKEFLEVADKRERERARSILSSIHCELDKKSFNGD